MENNGSLFHYSSIIGYMGSSYEIFNASAILVFQTRSLTLEKNIYFRFPINEYDVDLNESIQSIAGDEDDLLDDEEQQEDQLDDDETPENNDINSSQLDQIQSSTSTITTRNVKVARPIQDEFLSEDDEPIMIQPETRLITLFGLLERTFNLLKRCRQLVHDMHNIGVVQGFVSMEIGKKDVALH
ncbi:unnamed protein product [Rotaria magnacalcarata]|uniref:Uncharacterized protein n=1 Tax=Rotaria magnacalcarata TaxID=392030 RepID=A0A817AB58_9BILA|nr:unnamed protein product [Rotaria magnacalcarata]CAF2262187.1 unnamed protein product [Rotaria magnacalcarata]CAF4498837.1 unnamed protein product [Rotaria magnacalcarata]CAF4547111.1 unnamed protein product [Rotaria magnacalcarata]